MAMMGLSRLLINTLLLRRLPGPFTHESGHCWMVHLPKLEHLSDDASNPRRSTLAVYDDGIPLRPAHMFHAEIREVGHGCFSHWGDKLYFSTLDNSDPNTNRRTYRYSLSPWLYRRRTYVPPETPLPVNHQKRDASLDQIKADVDYILNSGLASLHKMMTLSPSVAGKTVLELGPGTNFGLVMLLAAFGMLPAVADRFLAPWDDDYHQQFYATLADELARCRPDADVRCLRALVEANGYPREIVAQYECATEDLNVVPTSSFDFVFSNAVGEHLYDVKKSFRQLYRITRPGGFGLHQIDFRDHRGFDRPLEFLLLEEKAFWAEFTNRHGECGNRWRPDEVTAFMSAAGFEVLGFEGNIFCTPEYLADFIPRLRVARSRYRNRTAESLRTLSGSFRLRKPAR
jgi:SAM-dependent methyltransferase